jgi:flagella basal body P-ring formation protein FlgA
MMKLFQNFLVFCVWISVALDAFGVELGPRQGAGEIQQTVEQFLHVQSAGIPGEISISIGTIDPHLYLTRCPGLEAFLPSGNKAWGKTNVGVRCNEPSRWTIYVPATVHVFGDYVATVTTVMQGQVVGEHDVAIVRGDLTMLPAGVITDLSHAIGYTTVRSLPSGMPIRLDSLRIQQAVQQGQIVRLISSGEGFRVSTEARALANAMDGQMVQAKTAGGQIVSGVAKIGGMLEVNY